MRHLGDHERYIELRDHNAPILGEIYGLRSEIKYWDARRRYGNKYDSDLSDLKYSEIEWERKIHNAPFDKKISRLERKISDLRKQLR
ncbi:hypothetical protein D3C72_2312640 [compost metagenome]